MKIAGSLVRNVDFFASTCLVSSRWFGKLEEISDSNVSKQIDSHVVFCGMRGTL